MSKFDRPKEGPKHVEFAIFAGSVSQCPIGELQFRQPAFANLTAFVE